MSEVVEKELPESWELLNFEDIISPVKHSMKRGPFGSALKKSFFVAEGYKIYEQKNAIQDNSSLGEYFITEEKYLELENFKVEPGDFIISCSGTIGRITLVPSNAKPGIINQALLKIKINNEVITPEYFLYFFRSDVFQKKVLNKTRGVAIKNIASVKDIKGLPVPVPPPEQQKRIVAKIEELFSHIDAGIDALKKAKQLLKQYRQSVLKAAVTGELLGYVFSSDIFKTIDYGLESLGQGWSPKCNREPSPSEDVWGVIKTTAIQSLEYRQDENKRLPEKLEPRPHLEIMVGDILVTRAGPRVRVGVCCLVKETRSKLMICDKAYRLRPKVEKILPEYLEITLNAPQVQKEIEKLKSGISDSGLNLTQKRFVELTIPYPSLDEQKQLISLVYEKTQSIARLENELEIQLMKANKNKQSILASAFCGNLHD